MIVFLQMKNLLDEDIRKSTSFLRNFTPEPGREIVFGVGINFNMINKYGINLTLVSLPVLSTAVLKSYAQGITTCNAFGHFDVIIDVDPAGTDGASLLIDESGQFPAEASTGRTVVPADFGDFAGGRIKPITIG